MGAPSSEGVHFKSLFRRGLNKGLLADKWMFGKPEDTRVHLLGTSLSCERVGDGKMGK